MALARMKATTIALKPEMDRLLTRAARARGVSRSEFVRQQLALVLEQFREHPRPRSVGAARRRIWVKDEEAGLFAELER
jgi:predicted transcriptional regulator